MVTDEFHNVIDKYNKFPQEKKYWQILLEASQIEVDLLAEELEEIRLQLNRIWKSPSYSFVRSNKTIIYRRNYSNHSSNRLNGSISNYFSFIPISNITCSTCGDIGHKSFNYRKRSSGKWIWRPKTVNHRGPNKNWVPKRN